MTIRPWPTGDAQVRVLSKWRLIAAFWVVQAAVLWGVTLLWGLQADTVERDQPLGRFDAGRASNIATSSQFWIAWLLVVPGLMLVQAAVVWPVRRPIARSERGAPLWASIAATALIAAALAAAAALAFGTFWEVMDWPFPLRGRVLDLVFAAWCLLCFGVGFVLLRAFCVRELSRGVRHELVLGRVAATLFTGTLIEVLAIIPLDVIARRKVGCYSLTGTLWAYAVAICAGAAALGPAILLPVLARRRKRWYAGRCDACGYDMSGLLAADRHIERCPECGTGWRAPVEEGKYAPP